MKKYFTTKRSLIIFAFLSCLLLLRWPAHPAEIEFPLLQSLSYFPYSDNSILEKGTFSASLDLYHSNVYMFNHYRTMVNDFEVFSSTVGVRYGLMPGGTLELYYRHSWIFGGILDKAIENFHSTFNLPDDNRAAYPRSSVNYWYKDYFSYTSGRNAASPLILAFLKKLYQRSSFSLNTRLAVGLPLSNVPGLSSGKPFVTAGLVALYKKGRFSLEFSNTITFLKKPTWLYDEDIYPRVFLSRLETTFKRFIAGFIFRTSVFKEDDIAHDGYQVYFGYKIKKFLQFIIMEDFAPFDTTPDLSFLIRIKLL